MSNLTYVLERCRSVCEITPFQSVQVKGENYILEVLKEEYEVVKSLSSIYPSIQSVDKSMYDFIVYLDRKYTEPRRFRSTHLLDFKDAEKLKSDTLDWRNTILDVYKERGTIYITQLLFEDLYSEQLVSTLNSTTKDDLIDAFTCVIHLFPTPAAMISFRVVESIVRQIYEEIIGLSYNNKPWSILTTELKKHQKLSGPFVGYLDYLRQKRNEAEHPDKRFTQEESEKILLDIKGLLEERLKIK